VNNISGCIEKYLNNLSPSAAQAVKPGNKVLFSYDFDVDPHNVAKLNPFFSLMVNNPCLYLDLDVIPEDNWSDGV
jgi:hypothetical protein